MKKCYRMFICLVLVVCLLLLPGCKPAGNDTLDQTDTMQTIAEEQPKQEIKVNWEPKFLRVYNVDLWEEDAPKIHKVLDYEDFAELKSGLHGTCDPMQCFQYDADAGLCAYAKSLQNLSYSKAFFEENSLILVGLSSGSGSTIFEVTDLTYADGAITCDIDIPYAKYIVGTADMASWYCFIALDTVLPADTQITVNTEAVEVDMETYEQKYNQFTAESVY